MGIRTIARVLNQRQVKCGKYRHWDRSFIRRLITHPKYVGSVVFNRGSQKLGSKRVPNPPDRWIVKQNVFPAIVSQDVFERTQAKIRNHVINRSNEQLLEELRVYISEKGKGPPSAHKAGDLACLSTYSYRFGSILNAYKAVGYQSKAHSLEALSMRRRIACIKAETNQQIQHELSAAGIPFSASRYSLQLLGNETLLLDVARCYSANGALRWRVYSKRLRQGRWVIIARLQPGNESVKDFILLAKAVSSTWGFTFSEKRIEGLGLICHSAKELASSLVSLASASSSH